MQHVKCLWRLNTNRKTDIYLTFAIFPTEYCYLPHHRGNGNEILARYFYNSETNRCELFLYKGNGGNLNNFMSVEDCRRTCIPRSSNRRWLTGNTRSNRCEEGFEV